jgi:CPA1 family monovalent cation:H+ antiporter
MRGVIALAAAMSLPATLADGSPFPQRNLILFLTFSVILVTLVLQGLTLPPLIRAMGLAGAPDSRCDEAEARRLVLQAALDSLKNQRKNEPAFAGVYNDLEQHYRSRLASLPGAAEDAPGERPNQYSRFVEVSRRLLDTEREAALRLRNEGRISDEVLREIERELDLNVMRLDSARA